MANAGRGRSLARPRQPVKVEVAVDPARRKRFEALAAILHRSRREEAQGFDAYWEAVGEIIEAELYVAGGYDTADAFLAREVKVPRRTALRMVRVAKYASPVEEQRYGTAVLDAALGYIEALTGGPIEGKLPIAFDKLRVPVDRDGATKKLSLDEVTVAEIQRATTEKLRGSKKSRVQKSPHESALAAAFAKVAVLEGVSVRVAGGKVRIAGAPLEALAALAKVLAAVKVPAPAASPRKNPPAPTTKRAAKKRDPK